MVKRGGWECGVYDVFMSVVIAVLKKDSLHGELINYQRRLMGLILASFLLSPKLIQLLG